jgi:carbamoyl-phosphate synthase small subunit
MASATFSQPPVEPHDGTSAGWRAPLATGVLVLASGDVIEGFGVGATGSAVGEVCFNTAMTGYQEILTDPSYAAQIITFTFPHIGIVGANGEDVEVVNSAAATAAVGAIFRADLGEASNFRSHGRLDAWLKSRGVVGLTGIDTRALTTLIRKSGMPNAVIAHAPDGVFDLDALRAEAGRWPGIDGMDLVPQVGTTQRYDWNETSWTLESGYGKRGETRFHVVAVDYGVKRNILRLLNDCGCSVTVVPATATAEEILGLKPDGVFLSNGPGDPAETGAYAVPTIRALLDTKIPLFGICLGHQLLGLAVGGRTIKMPQGHHGANHPVKDFTTGKVEIVSMNHGFAVDRVSLPETVKETHVSLFDGSNCGVALTDRPAFSVQYHPEASPGPRDSHYLFRRFVGLMETAKGGKAAAG